jgi:hypothetical protein
MADDKWLMTDSEQQKATGRIVRRLSPWTGGRHQSSAIGHQPS